MGTAGSASASFPALKETVKDNSILSSGCHKRCSVFFLKSPVAYKMVRYASNSNIQNTIQNLCVLKVISPAANQFSDILLRSILPSHPFQINIIVLYVKRVRV